MAWLGCLAPREYRVAEAQLKLNEAKDARAQRAAGAGALHRTPAPDVAKISFHKTAKKAD